MGINADILNRKIFERRIANDALSVLTGVPTSTLSQALRGTKDLPTDRFNTVNKMLDDLAALEVFIGAPLRWQDTERVKELLDRMYSAQRRKAQQTAEDRDREIIAAALVGEDPRSVAERFGISITELCNKIEAASNKLQSQIDGVRAATCRRIEEPIMDTTVQDSKPLPSCPKGHVMAGTNSIFERGRKPRCKACRTEQQHRAYEARQLAKKIEIAKDFEAMSFTELHTAMTQLQAAQIEQQQKIERAVREKATAITALEHAQARANDATEKAVTEKNTLELIDQQVASAEEVYPRKLRQITAEAQAESDTVPMEADSRSELEIWELEMKQAVSDGDEDLVTFLEAHRPATPPIDTSNPANFMAPGADDPDLDIAF